MNAARALTCMLTLLGMLAVSCEKERDELPSLETKASAAQAIAKARCDRELQCRLDRASCFEVLYRDAEGALNTTLCRRGVDSRALAECLEQIDQLSCDASFVLTHPFEACSSTELCLNSLESLVGSRP